MSVGPLTFQLCDLEQTVLTDLDDRRDGGRVVIGRHAPRSAEVELALDDPAADLVSAGDTVLRCTVEGWSEPLFVGRANQADVTYDESRETMLVRGIDPMAHLERCLIFATLGFSPAAISYKDFTAAQQAQIMWDLIDLVAGHEHGVAEGTLPNSVTRTLSFPAGSSVAEAIRSVAGMLNGPEFEFTPTAATDGTLVTFNAFYPRQGSDKTATVVFKIGTGEAE